jgi:hypothetical protein
MHFAEMMVFHHLMQICMAVINIIREFTTHEAGVAAALLLHLITNVAVSPDVHPLLLLILCNFFFFVLPATTPPMKLPVPQVTFRRLI